MSAAPLHRRTSMTNPVLVAMIISLVIHLGGYGVWKAGLRFGWWQQNRFSLFVKSITDKLMPVPKITNVQPPQQAEPPLMFVEVNPAMAIAKAPEHPKYEGAISTQAASPKQADSDIPKIEGAQEEHLKITDNGKPQAVPLQEQTKVSPPEKKEEQTKASEVKAGDLAYAKPRPKSQPQQTPSADDGQAQETRHRPRTLAEAKKRNGSLGEKSKQDGGTQRLDLSSSLDVKGTAFGDYVAELVEAVKERWYAELDQVSATTPGKVVIEFRLHSSGRVTDVKVGESNVGELLSLICQKAIQDPSPYKPWPKELQREMGANYKDVSFTFYYLRN